MNMYTLLASIGRVDARRRGQSERGLIGGIWLPQESHAACRCLSLKSLRYILASPVYAPVYAVNVTWKERGFNTCQTHRSMYPSIFNRFPVIQPEVQKFAILAHFCTLWPPWVYAPRTIAVNVTWIEREFNAGQTPCSIYPSIFNHF